MRSVPALTLVLFAASSCDGSSKSPEPQELATPGNRADRTAIELLRERYDHDRNGRISPEEYGGLPEVFARLDRDGDGSITTADFDVVSIPPPGIAGPYYLLRLLRAEAAGSIGPDEVLPGFDQADKNDDGKLDPGEVLTIVGPSGTLLLFSLLDVERTGTLAFGKIVAYVKRRDMNGDGRLAQREREEPGEDIPTGWFAPESRSAAPPLRLPVRDGSGTAGLDEHRGARPVALVFGSFT